MLKEADRLRFKNRKRGIWREIQGAFDEEGRLKADPEQKLIEGLREFVGSPQVLPVSHVRSAVDILFRTYEVGEGDAVFLPVFAPQVLLRVLKDRGAKPIFVAIHPRTFTIDVRGLQEAIKEVMAEAKFRARVILAVDAFGLPCDFPALQKIAERYGMFLFDLALDGIGGGWHRQACPSFGDAGVASFDPGCSISGMHGGAAIFCEDEKIFRKMQSWVMPAFSETDEMIALGTDVSLHPLECAFLLPRVKAYQDSEGARLAELASFYSAQLQDILEPPFVPAGFESGWQAYVLTLPENVNREDFRKALNARGIESGVPAWYDLAAIYRKLSSNHEHDSLGRKAERNSKFTEQLVTLPLHPYLTKDHAAEVIDKVREVWDELSAERSAENG